MRISGYEMNVQVITLVDMTTADGSEPEPQWLTSGQLRAWRELSELMAHLPTAVEDQLKRDAGLSLLEYLALADLADQPDHARRLSDLARDAHSELSRVSHLITRLARRGLVRRVTDPTDGRYTKAVLTDAGHGLLVKVAPAHVAEVRRLVFDVLDDADVAALQRAAAKINAPNDCSRHI
jgi:DNA-binding MarR family transcriptional regulator